MNEQKHKHKHKDKDRDRQAQEAVEETAVPSAKTERPAAGPHATEAQTDAMKTPGTGLLQEDDEGGVTPPSS